MHGILPLHTKFQELLGHWSRTLARQSPTWPPSSDSSTKVPNQVQKYRNESWFQKLERAGYWKEICLHLTSIQHPHKHRQHLEVFNMGNGQGGTAHADFNVSTPSGVVSRLWSSSSKHLLAFGKAPQWFCFQKQNKASRNSFEKQRSLIVLPSPLLCTCVWNFLHFRKSIVLHSILIILHLPCSKPSFYSQQGVLCLDEFYVGEIIFTGKRIMFNIVTNKHLGITHEKKKNLRFQMFIKRVFDPSQGSK